MAGLIHNQTFRIMGGASCGIYRVILAEASIGQTVVALIEGPTPEDDASAHIPAIQTRKKNVSKPLCGKLYWFETSVLDEMAKNGVLYTVDLARNNFNDSPASAKHFEFRKKIMDLFLDFDAMRSAIRSGGDVGGLVADAVERHGASRTLVYTCWSLLCRYGFGEDALRPRLDRCGAPGRTRDCSPGGRRKAGRKTNGERIALRTGKKVSQSQPGMCAEWRTRIIVADRKIPNPKPKFPKRFNEIITEGFAKNYCDSSGKLTSEPLKMYEYPNEDQVRRVLKIEIPQIQRLLESTTKGHFLRTMRGLTARSWKGVSGPGHTWQIDSTIADIYLRSSINPAWVIGRPILYVMVDVWSTAVVGFYVCLRGPSWDMAKTALFCSVADPGLLSELWGFEQWEPLYPRPGIPLVLLTDRGEYVSAAAKETAFKLFERMSHAAPYRPDMKGLVEVLNRITKDHQYWLPGAIDARNEEFGRLKFDKKGAALTLSEYAAQLHLLFTEYNLTADRSKRMDTHMIAAGVSPSPAGLWRWGHEIGIGVQRYRSESELIKLLLPANEAKVSKGGIDFDGLSYAIDKVALSEWTCKARNFGSWSLPIHHFPGSVSRIWTPDMEGTNLLEMRISDQANAPGTQTYEEVQDAFAYQSRNLQEVQHERMLVKQEAHRRAKEINVRAETRTKEAVKSEIGSKPTTTEARQIEANIMVSTPSNQTATKLPHSQQVDDECDAYFEMMNTVLKAKG